MSDSTATEPPAPAALQAGKGCDIFVTTRWSVVLSAKGEPSLQSKAALETLCRTYWQPIYTFVRRRGHSPHDAQDLTQEFFARLLQRDAVSTVNPCKGRFRSFLLASLNHFLSDEWDKARAQKRGAGRIFPMDTATAESAQTACPTLSPERAFDRQWAVALLGEVHERLRVEYTASGKATHFDTLRFALAGSRSDVPYKELAASLQTSEGAVKVAVHRLRQRYREILRESVADTMAGTADVEQELRDLFRALAGN